MNYRHAAAATLTATAALLLTACSSDAGDSSPSASAAGGDSVANVGQILTDVRTATACEPWVGGKLAGEGVVAAWSYTCDADADGTVDSTLFIYDSADARDGDLPAVEGGSAGAAIVTGDGYIVVTTVADHVSALEGIGADVVRALS